MRVKGGRMGGCVDGMEVSVNECLVHYCVGGVGCEFTLLSQHKML